MNRQLPIRSLLFAVALAFVSQSVFAQQMRISGRVCDSSGPVIGAVAVVKGTMRGISTDFDGQYVIDVAPGETLVFSYVGLQSVEVPIDATTKSPLNITLQETSTVLSDVVVVGYGKQTKQSVTGAISQVKGDELMKAGGVTNVSSALTGLVPGLVTLNYSGKPGQDDAEIFIRTVSTWNDASPLVLIDGIERGMNDIDLGEVENISVLKDASATAVFGVRGGNGVILITTKRGKEGSPTFSASANVTLKMSSKLPKNADSYTGLWYRNQAIENQVSMNGDLWSEYTPTEILRRYRDGDNPYLYPNVDWQSEMLRKHSWSQRYALDVRGGTKFVKYYGSLAYVYDGDVLKGQDFGQGYVPKNDYKRFNFRTNLDFQPTATTTISVDIDGAWGIERTTTATPAYLWPGIYSKGPDQYPVRYEDGTFANNESGYAMYNPVEYFNFSGLERHTRMDINTSFTLNQKLDFVTKGLSFRAMANFQNYYWSIGPNITASRPITKYIDWKTGEETINYPSDYTNSTYGFDYVLGKYTLSTENIWSSGGSPKMSKNLMYQAQFNYNRTFGLHKVSGLILFKRIENAAGSAFPSYREEWAGRATYDFDNRYLFEFNAAYNGSEKFAKGNKFGFFPSAAVGWILSEEPFFRRSELKRFVDLFKFRYSWGKVGSDSGINRWLYMTQWSKATSTAWLGSPSASRPEYSGFHITNIGNPDAKWETAVKNDFAVEASFFKNTLSLTFDYYWGRRYDIFMSASQRNIPPWFGADPVAANIGKTKERGWELEMRYNNSTKFGLKYYATAMFSHGKDEIVYMEDPEFTPAYQKKAGYQIGQQTSYLHSGVITSWDQMYTGAAVENTSGNNVGMLQLIDYNGDGVIDTNDIVPYGYPNRPQYTMNFTVGAEWKGISLSVQLYGTRNCTLVRSAGEFSSPHYYTVLDTSIMGDMWLPGSQEGGTYHHPVYKGSGASVHSGSFNMVDGTQWRIKNAELAYTLTAERLRKAGITSLRFYISGNNLWLFSHLNEDRETGGTRTNDNVMKYPLTKRYTFGVKIEF